MTMKKTRLRSIFSCLPLSVASLVFVPSLASGFGCCGTPPVPLNGFGEEGPYATEAQALTDRCDVIQPANAGVDAAPFPVVLWAGGVGTATANYYQGRRLIASYGFVVGSVGNAPNGLADSESLLSCLDTITNTPSLRVDVSKVAVAGHSLGGSAAVHVGTDNRVDTTVLIQPILGPGTGHDKAWNSQQQGPVLLLVGELDTMVSIDDTIEPFFESVNTPIFAPLAYTADHFEPVGDFGQFAPIITGWLRYQFYDDAEATELFVLPEQLVCKDRNFACEIEGTFE